MKQWLQKSPVFKRWQFLQHRFTPFWLPRKRPLPWLHPRDCLFAGLWLKLTCCFKVERSDFISRISARSKSFCCELSFAAFCFGWVGSVIATAALDLAGFIRSSSERSVLCRAGRRLVTRISSRRPVSMDFRNVFWMSGNPYSNFESASWLANCTLLRRPNARRRNCCGDSLAFWQTTESSVQFGCRFLPVV